MRNYRMEIYTELHAIFSSIIILENNNFRRVFIKKNTSEFPSRKWFYWAIRNCYPKFPIFNILHSNSTISRLNFTVILIDGH